MFSWKKGTEIFKGEGIYHLTWVVENRVPLLGSLEPLPTPNSTGHIAWVRATPLGRAILRKFTELDQRHPQLQILHKELMPNHLHAVVWMHEGFEGSIKMVARGFAQGCSKIAREMAAANAANAENAENAENAQYDCARNNNTPQTLTGNSTHNTNTPEAVFLPVQSHCTNDPLDCGNGAHTLFSTPFIRTLSHKGQLQSMIDYNRANPDNAWLRHLHPELYTIRRKVQHGELLFDTMGKARLLAYPERQIIALSRSLSKDQIATEVQRALLGASMGRVTLTAAINEGERAVARAIREAGFPLVVMLLQGFPPEGTEAARYFHPSGIYHKLCGEGLLYLMAPVPSNYDNPHLITATEQELRRKAELKHLEYRPIPHTSTRWRMIAGNMMLGMV